MADPLSSTPRRGRGSAGRLLALLFGLLLGAGGMGVAVRRSAPLAAWLHPLAAPAVQRVIVRVPAPPAPPEVQALAARLAAAEARLDALDRSAAQTSGDADRADGLLVAFAARRALDRGQPLGFLEGMLRDRFGATDAPAVATVIAAGQRPVTLAQLQDGLADLLPTLTSARGGGWWAAVRAELAGLLVVHRADRPSTRPVDRLHRATQALAGGQVDQAAAEVAQVPGAARAADWLALAHRYVAARGALDRLETAALLKPRPDAITAPVPVTATLGTPGSAPVTTPTAVAPAATPGVAATAPAATPTAR